MEDGPVLVRQDLEGGVVRLSLASGPGNPISLQLLQSLSAALTQLEQAPPRALVLDGGTGKLFSGGLDVKQLVHFDRVRMHHFLHLLGDVLARFTTLPLPTLCAIHGHAVAGGFILPLACDLRVVQTGKLKLGLSEADLAIPVPAGAQVLLRERTSPSTSLRLSMFGTLVTPEQAADLLYADVLAEDAQAEALELAAVLAAKPGGGVAASKGFVARDLAERVRVADARHIGTMLDHWCGEVGQAQLRALAERLS